MPKTIQEGCSCCGAHPIYRDALCRPCWLRNERNGSPEPATMTANELLDLLREYDVPCGYDALAELIEEGKIPGALGTKKPQIGRRSFIIFRRPVMKWLKEMTHV